MEYNGQNYFKAAITGKTQANGAQTIDVTDSLPLGEKAKRHWQVQFVPSATPAAGTATIGIKTPGASGFATLATTVDLTSSALLVSFDAVAEAILITPTDFDAAKTYSAFLCAV